MNALGSHIDQTELRARFAASLSMLYGGEVPLYRDLVDVSAEVNRRTIARLGPQAERLGSIERVTAERHGAIRVGTPAELGQVARVFGAVGMYPCGFYDLRDAAPAAIPVVSTAFRPLARDELARNPFRVFTSLLVADDRRFFSPELQRRLETFLQRRRLFSDNLLALADRSEREHGLPAAEAEQFITLATAAFALSDEPVDRGWYDELSQVSSVAADIGGVATTHINHLTPRVLDIDALYTAMTDRGVEMIDAVQGPPRWNGPDVLLRQTSFRALAEPRRFRLADGSVVDGSLRVRFGEVEARGLALTPSGRGRYDDLMARVDPAAEPEAAARLWAETMPGTEAEFERDGLAYFTYSAQPDRRRESARGSSLPELLDAGVLRAEPIVYEDFLPRSAAGIFSSNLTADTAVDESQDGSGRDADWLAGAMGRTLHDPFELYAAERDESLRHAATELGLRAPMTAPATTEATALTR